MGEPSAPVERSALVEPPAPVVEYLQGQNMTAVDRMSTIAWLARDQARHKEEVRASLWTESGVASDASQDDDVVQTPAPSPPPEPEPEPEPASPAAKKGKKGKGKGKKGKKGKGKKLKGKGPKGKTKKGLKSKKPKSKKSVAGS